jgi:hypothetical protein
VSRGELLATPFRDEIPTGERTLALRHIRLRCWNVRSDEIHSASTRQICRNKEGRFDSIISNASIKLHKTQKQGTFETTSIKFP